MRLKLRILYLFILVSIGLIFVSRGVSIEKIMMGRVEIPIYLLTVTGSGAGSGTIIGNVYGINCTSTVGVESGICSAYIPSGTIVILTATPIPGNSFGGWTGSGCSGTGICTIVMDGDKTIDASFLDIPLPDYLIGWYKFNEGSGNVVENFATNGSLGGGVLPNLSVSNWDGTFWVYLPGFASSPSFGGSNFARAILGSPRDYGTPQGFGIFYRYGVWSGNYYYGILHGSLTNTLLYTGWGSLFKAEINSKPYRFWNLNTWSASVAALNEWIFMFSNEDTFYVVNSTGVLTSTATTSPTVEPFQFLIVGAIQSDPVFPAAGNYGASGTYSDLIIYNFISPSLAEWAWRYDLLRARYGMAPRSGW